MGKQQTGLRMDRILFGQFKELCTRERLRPGEVVENMIRAVVDSGTTSFSLNSTGLQSPGRRIDRLLFRSKLSRMKNTLENEYGYLKAVGNMRPYGLDSELYEFERGLAELAKNCPDEELVEEFEKILKEMDKLFADVDKSELTSRLKTRMTSP